MAFAPDCRLVSSSEGGQLWRRETNILQEGQGCHDFP